MGGRTDLAGALPGARTARVLQLHRRKDRPPYPLWLGYWPAVFGLFAFVWLELASPDPGSVAAIRSWLLIYVAVTFAGALWFGERWCARADPFELYSVVAWRLSVFRRQRDTGRVAALSVLLGSTASTASRRHRCGVTSSTRPPTALGPRRCSRRRHSRCSCLSWPARSPQLRWPPQGSTGSDGVNCPG